MFSIEEQLKNQNKMPALRFLPTWNCSRPSVDFTMELEANGRLSGNFNCQEWLPVGYKGLETNGHWVIAALTKPC